MCLQYDQSVQRGHLIIQWGIKICLKLDAALRHIHDNLDHHNGLLPTIFTLLHHCYNFNNNIIRKRERKKETKDVERKKLRVINNEGRVPRRRNDKSRGSKPRKKKKNITSRSYEVQAVISTGV